MSPISDAQPPVSGPALAALYAPLTPMTPMMAQRVIVLSLATLLALWLGGCAARLQARADEAQAAAQEAIEQAEAAGATEQALAEARYLYGRAAKALDNKRYPKAQRLFRRARKVAREAHRMAGGTPASRLTMPGEKALVQAGKTPASRLNAPGQETPLVQAGKTPPAQRL